MKKILFIMGAAALLFTSCKKDDDNNPGGGGGTPTQKLLKKMTKVEDNVTTVYNFTYSGGKLVSVKTPDASEMTVFTYDAAGNVTKVEQEDTEFRNIYTYTYANGIPVSGSFKSWMKDGANEDLIEDDVLTYTVTDNKVSQIQLQSVAAGMDFTFDLTYSNGNLSKVKTSNIDFYEADFTYGNKKAPYPAISKWVLDHAGFSLMFSSKNELLSAAYNFPGTELDKTLTNQYTYDAGGYVLTSNDGSAQVTYEYQ